MATLAPTVPSQGDPEYLRYSRPISGIEGDKSGYYLGKGLGEAIQEGATTGVKIAGEVAENETYEKLNAAAEREGQRLDVAEANLLGTQPQGAVDSTGTLITKDQDIPTEVNRGTKTIAALKERYDNGKISQTDYLSERAKILKDLNAQYPGFRNYISAGASRATGEGSADALIRARISDYNSIMSKLSENKNKVDSQFYSSLKYMPDNVRKELINRRSLDPNDPKYLSDAEALFNAGKYEYHEKDIERKIQGFELKDHERKASQEDFKDAVTGVVASNMATFGHNLVASQGVSTFEQLADKLNDPALSDTDKLKIAQDFRTNLDLLKNKLQSDGARLVKGKGSTGFGELNKQITDATAFLEDQAKRMIDPNNVTSAVFATKHYLDAQHRDLNALIWNQPQAKKLAIAKALDDINPEAAGRINTNTVLNEKDFSESTKGMYTSLVRSMLGVPRNGSAGSPPTVKEYQDEAEKAGVSSKNQMKFIKTIDLMLDKSLPDEKAYRIGKSFFDPKNQGLVGKWTIDKYDSRTGKSTEGSVSILRKLGSEEVSNRVKELSGKYPDLLTDYTDFILNTAKREVFPSLMDDVRNLSVTAGNRLIFHPEDPRNPFEIIPVALSGTAQYSKVMQQGITLANRPLQSAVNKLNYVWQSMANVGKIAEVKDPNVFVLSQLMSERPDMFSQTIQGFPGEINRAIQGQMLAREMEKQKAEAQKKKNIEESR